MNKDNIQGNFRSVTGEVKEFAGKATGDRETQASGTADKIIGQAQAALGSTKDAISSAASAAADLAGGDFQTLRDDINRLTDTVTKLVNDKVSSASDTVARAASATQDKVMSIEEDLENRVRSNPLMAIAIAVGVGALLGSMSSTRR